MIELLKDFRTISIIGTAKNVGKTTTLNHLLRKLQGKKIIGITSIGRDGESLDIVTNTPKPKIFVDCGTIIATTKGCLSNSDITKQILETTDINTPLGKVVIVRALSAGFVYLSGPSFNEGVKHVIDIFKRYNVELTLIDGATSRKALADNFVSEATIIATGAALHFNIEQVVNMTADFVKMFRVPAVIGELKDQFEQVILEASITIIDKSGDVNKLQLPTALTSEKIIIDQLSKDSNYLILKGALTMDLALALLNNRNRFEKLVIIVKNGTKCFLTDNMIERLERNRISLRVLESTNLLCVTYNPKSPFNYEFDDETFRRMLTKAVRLPILNVLREKS